MSFLQLHIGSMKYRANATLFLILAAHLLCCVHTHYRSDLLPCRSKVTSMLLPRLEAFNPDLLFISAGFDAHHDDWYHFLTEQDLHWVTEQLCAVADRCGSASRSSSSSGVSNGDKGSKRKCGVISVLEGGYSLSSPLPPATKSKTAKAAPAATVPTVNPSSSIPSGTNATGSAASVIEAPAGSAGAVVGVASPTGSGEATGAAAVLGRGGRGKAKKGTTASTSVIASPPVIAVSVPAEPVVKIEHTTAQAVLSGGLSYKQALQSAAAFSESTVVATTVIASNASSAVFSSKVTHEEIMYAQRPGDGGLVKG